MTCINKFYLFIVFFVLISCKIETFDNIPYDVIVVAGQSNTHAGLGLNRKIDISDGNIFQLGRIGFFDRAIIPANEPLHHHTAGDSRIGFALTFAKLFYEKAQEKRPILIIPCGFGGTSIPKDWSENDFLYQDMIERTKFVLKKFPKSNLKSILWHQGESDVGNRNYASLLDNFINRVRVDLDINVPFIVGGMVPFWVANASSRIEQQNIIKNTPLRVDNTNYADPEIPFVIKKEDDLFDEIHYDANGQRELGRRYFDAYIELISK